MAIFRVESGSGGLEGKGEVREHMARDPGEAHFEQIVAIEEIVADQPGFLLPGPRSTKQRALPGSQAGMLTGTDAVEES